MNDMHEIIEEIKLRNDIVDIISSYIQVKSAGLNYKALCPFHSEKTPSFSISTQKQMYKCFGCGEGGDVINFVMKMENVDFMEALEILAQRSGVEIKKGKISDESKQNINKKQKLYQINLDAARYFFKSMSGSNNNGYKYLKDRGLDDKTIKYFGLGFAKNDWNDLNNYLLQKGYEQQDLIDSGLAIQTKNKKNYINRFKNRVMFPIFDQRGKVIAFGGRVLDHSLPKYLNSSETMLFNKRKNLYALNFAKKNIKNDTLIVVEGYMDVISLFQYGIKNVVASLGTALTVEQAKLIKKYVNKVIVAYDNDEAGINATLKAVEIFNEVKLNIKVLNLGKAKDPDEYIRKEGVDKFNILLKNSIPLLQFKIDILKKKYDLNNDQDRLLFTKNVANIIKNIKSPIEVEYYINKISKETNISIDAINSEIYGKYYKKNKSKKESNKKVEEIKIKKSGIEIAEKQIISIFINEKKYRNDILMNLEIDDFLFEESKEILNYIIKSNELDIITIDKLKKIGISENYIDDIYDIKIDSSINLNDIIKTLQRNSLKKKRDYLLKRQDELQLNKKNDKNIEASEVDRELLDIAMKIIRLEKEMKNIL
ncbi:DNA primase [Tepidibacter hydrothermalis]|uniref:DNA primase n=1 Tax=Tepidibacter hydrothermalis TaxID=3036126 RepID=A0ABY8EJT3_9FIRM|nr:DNA primase [Tepidibacter hydrothermalis]WFD12109.1 DNA primase [Tepidibacter hydrothermalis]